MADLILPGDSRHALALREPALLVPGKRPVGSLRVNPYWLGKGLRAAYLFGGQYGYGTDLAYGRKATWLGVTLGPDYVRTARSVGSYVDLPLGANLTPPLTFVVDSFIEGGTVQWSYLRNQLNWDGWYGPQNGRGLCVANNSFSGDVPATGTASAPEANTFVMCYAGANNLRAAYRGGAVVVDTWVTAPAATNRNFATIGGSRLNTLENTSTTRCRLFAVFEAALSNSELRLLSADPYGALFDPANSSPYLISIPGGAATLPTLSTPTLVSAGGNTYQPRVTATYS